MVFFHQNDKTGKGISRPSGGKLLFLQDLAHFLTTFYNAEVFGLLSHFPDTGFYYISVQYENPLTETENVSMLYLVLSALPSHGISLSHYFFQQVGLKRLVN